MTEAQKGEREEALSGEVRALANAGYHYLSEGHLTLHRAADLIDRLLSSSKAEPADGEIEAAAKRIFHCHNGDAADWDGVADVVKNGCRRFARAALTPKDPACPHDWEAEADKGHRCKLCGAVT